MRSLAFAFVALTVTAALLPAQGRGARSGDIPPGHRPPPGLCRIWIDGVPPGRQPAPSRCSDAVRDRPANARVIYGDDSRSSERRDNDGRWDRDDDDRNDGERDGDRDDDDRDGRWDSDDDRSDDRDAKSKGKHKSKSKHKNKSKHKDKSKHESNASRRPAGDLCYDRDRDGWCDWREGSRTAHERRTSDKCVDRNRDGRCDDAVPQRVSKEDVLGAIFGRPQP